MKRLFLLLALLGNTAASAMDMVTVPAGEFLMGCTQPADQCEDDEGPRGGKRVFVPAFAIDTREVTVAQYRSCVVNGTCQAPKTYVRNKYCNYDAPGRDNYPVNCVDWPDAQNYCSWQGKRLPLEAEWEKAARAGSETEYIWGHAPDCRQAILDDDKTKGSVKGEFDGCGEDRTWPVGSRAPNALGLFDMFGNVSEWVDNWYHPQAIDSYARGDIRAPKTGERKVIRGGAWDEMREALRSASRYAKRPQSGESVWGSNGFRCVREVSDNRKN